MAWGEQKHKIEIMENGPYLVSGNVPLTEKIIIPNSKINEYHQGRKFPLNREYALCRCGHSKTPPFCDGHHERIGFNGTETASRDTYFNRAEMLEGPDLKLMDDNRCAYARFCHREEGNVWELTERSDDPQFRKEAIKAAIDCPTGRLVALDRAGNPIEPHFEPSIEILQDPAEGVSGPVFVKGNIPIESAGGFFYEARNRIALCRCGKSRNKPFCDAAHISVKYVDE